MMHIFPFNADTGGCMTGRICKMLGVGGDDVTGDLDVL